MNTPARAAGELPGGLGLDGERHRDVLVWPLRGHLEEAILQLPTDASPVRRGRALLASTVARLGDLEPVTDELLSRLTVGDLQALGLLVRRAWFGDAIPCLLRCPREGCREQLSLELSATELLVTHYPEWPASWEETFRLAERQWRVRFRLPTGADQDAVGALPAPDRGAGEQLLLRSCIEECEPPLAGEEPVPSDLADALAGRMQELDPQAEIELLLDCPGCNGSFVSWFEAAASLAREARQRARHLFREVHLLASHYHWSEPAILDLAPHRRRLYLELITADRQPGGAV